jgi:hypothetical protein
MAINVSKVVVGGFAAGVVANIVGYVAYGRLLAARMDSDTVAVAPQLQGRGMSGGAIATNMIATFIIGFLLVWLYAAIRPRFGPGPKTAILAGLAVWVCAVVFHQDVLLLGLVSPTTYALAAIAGLVQSLAASWIGGMLYTEDVAKA